MKILIAYILFSPLIWVMAKAVCGTIIKVEHEETSNSVFNMIATFTVMAFWGSYFLIIK